MTKGNGFKDDRDKPHCRVLKLSPAATGLASTAVPATPGAAGPSGGSKFSSLFESWLFQDFACVMDRVKAPRIIMKREYGYALFLAR